MRVLRLAFVALLFIEVAFFALLIGLTFEKGRGVSIIKSRGVSIIDLSEDPFFPLSNTNTGGCTLPPPGCPQGSSIGTDLTIQGLQLKLFPPPPIQVQVGQYFSLSATLSAKDGKTPLSDLPGSTLLLGPSGSVDSPGGEERTTLHQLLGSRNTGCVSAALAPSPPSSIADISPSQAREHPLEEQSVTWTWIVTPMKAGQLHLPVQIEIKGENHCNGTDLAGPYDLSSRSNFVATVLDNSNWITRTIQNINVGEAITATLGTLLTTSVVGIIAILRKRFRGTQARTSLANTGGAPVVNQPKNSSGKKQRKKRNADR